MTPEEIKKNLNQRVRLRSERLSIDADYILTGAIFRKGERGFFYQAELQDIKHARSIVICKLEEIEAIK
jgi:hypothetical protein